MADLSESSTFDSVYQLERTDPVDAGTGGNGVSNRQAQNLTNRTKYLYDQIALILAGSSPLTNSPAQFDNTKNIATTEWVNSNTARYVDVYGTSSGSNYAVQAADAGKLLYFRGVGGGGNGIATLPNLAAVPPGACFHFKNENLLTVLNCQSGERFFVQDGNGAYPINGTVIYLHKDEEVKIFRSEQNTVLGTATPYWGVIIHSSNLLKVGQIFLNHGTAPRDGVACDGTLLSRAFYPRLWAYVNTFVSTIALSEAAWQAGSSTDKTKFSTGTITSGTNANFRMPLITDLSSGIISYWMKY